MFILEEENYQMKSVIENLIAWFLLNSLHTDKKIISTCCQGNLLTEFRSLHRTSVAVLTFANINANKGNCEKQANLNDLRKQFETLQLLIKRKLKILN